MTIGSLPLDRQNCWQRIGVGGDRSCPELAAVVHCHHCPVFVAAGRAFLDRSPPSGYLEEWSARLADAPEKELNDVQSVLIFRMRGEWLALPVGAVREVLFPRPLHRIPFRAGLLAGLVNVRGELHLSVHLERVLGIDDAAATSFANASGSERLSRLLVVERRAETWAFRVDEVDCVHRLVVGDVEPAPPTLARAAARFTRGLFRCERRAIGLLDEQRFFEGLRTSVR